MTSVVLPKLIHGLVNPSSLRRWSMGIRSRLPEHYRKRMYQMEEDTATGKAKAIHYIKPEGVWKPGEYKDTLDPVQNRPINVIYPDECHLGLWGGEGIVKGFIKKRKWVMRTPRIWVPELKQAIIYSEILDKYLKITVTESALTLIDDHFGLDNYILQTPEVDFHSNFALKLKSKLLLTLLDQTNYPDDPVKREKVYNKYKHYLTYSREEIEWLGLSEQEAIAKQEAIEKVLNKPRPLKDIFTEHLKKDVLLSNKETKGDNSGNEQREDNSKVSDDKT